MRFCPRVLVTKQLKQGVQEVYIEGCSVSATFIPVDPVAIFCTVHDI